MMSWSKRLTQAELTLTKEDYPAFDAAVDRSLAIIRYLDDTLDRRYDISTSLSRLYEYFCYELSRVKAGRNQTELQRSSAWSASCGAASGTQKSAVPTDRRFPHAHGSRFFPGHGRERRCTGPCRSWRN